LCHSLNRSNHPAQSAVREAVRCRPSPTTSLFSFCSFSSFVTVVSLVYGYWTQGQRWSLGRGAMKCCEKSGSGEGKRGRDRYRLTRKTRKPVGQFAVDIARVRIRVSGYFKQKLYAFIILPRDSSGSLRKIQPECLDVKSVSPSLPCFEMDSRSTRWIFYKNHAYVVWKYEWLFYFARAILWKMQRKCPVGGECNLSETIRTNDWYSNKLNCSKRSYLPSGMSRFTWDISGRRILMGAMIEVEMEIVPCR